MQQITVSTLVKYLKGKLDTDSNLQRVLVSGEISNYHRHYSGHLYFTLKDENAAINCVMFKSSAVSLSFEPKTGDKVIVTANTSIFESTGQLQLYVLKISLDGLGDLYAKYEQLKKSLTDEGIFDDDHKIVLSKKYIERVAVLVGDKSAAMSDIKTTFLRRWPLCNVDYYPVLVQGNDAPITIISTLKKVDDMDYDAIILARGGGSFEDLFCFNDEDLVRCIYDLKTFIITGVGHEQDYTLVDFVADMRAPTPTASVELITPNIFDVLNELNDIEYTLKDSISNKLDKYQMRLDYYLSKLVSFKSNLENISLKIDNNINNIKSLINVKLEKRKLEYKRLSTLLEAYSSDKTLKRGFSIVKQGNKVIKQADELIDDEFEIHFIDGYINARKV